MDIFSFLITRPLGFIIQTIYEIIPNYGLAIIIFTFLITAILLPLNYKSQKSMAKQQKLSPILKEIQKKYANDPEKLNKEMKKLYAENNVSMTGGCLPTLIQFPILIGLYQVITKPLSFMRGIDFNDPVMIDTVKTIMNYSISNNPATKLAGITMEQAANNYQIQLSKVAGEMINNPSAIKMFEGSVINMDQFMEAVPKFVIDFNFLGLDLSRVPSEIFGIFSGNFDWTLLTLLIIPALATFLTWLSSKMLPSAANNNKSDDQPKKRETGAEEAAPDMAATMSKSMGLMMPAMTLIFTFTLPTGIGLYWVASNGARIIQQYFMNKHLSKKEDELNVRPIEEKTDKSYKNRKKRK